MTKRKSQVEKSPSSSKKEKPIGHDDFLTIQERRFLEVTNVDNLNQEISDFQMRVKSLGENPWVNISYDRFNYDLFLQYHPDARKLLDNPNHIPDPNDYEYNIFTGAILRPKTNTDIYNSLWMNWRHDSLKKNEMKQYFTLLDERNGYEHDIRNCKSKIEEFEKMNQMVKQVVQMEKKVIENLEKLLATPDTKLKGILLPYGKTLEKSFIKKTGESFDTPIYGIYSSMTKYGQLIATLNMGGQLLVRNEKVVDEIKEALKTMAADPDKFFSELGKKLNICLFCFKTLSDAKSVEAGYGPVCGKYLNRLKK